VVETEDEYYCEACEANCERCVDKLTCTHCKVVPTRFHLEQGSCVSDIIANTEYHFAEYYDDFYTELVPCFFDTYLDEPTCDTCTDGGETSCTKCNSVEGYYMILNDESSDNIEGKCVEHCPFFYYLYNDGTDDFCLRKCPDGWGEDKQFGVCIECD